jgi:ferrous iron transport protein B
LTSDFIDALFNGSTSISILQWEIPFACQGLGPWLSGVIVSSGGSVWAADLLQNGVIAGFAAVINFLPQLIVLFYCMAFLEGSGYMNRIAFFLDKIFKKFGLSGKSIIPFIVGSGCSVPGVMSARTVENEKERNLTIALTPFIPCSAKLPIIALLSGVIFPGFGWVISLSVYFLAIVIILITALIAKHLRKNVEETSFISELPSYKWPNQRYAWREVFEKSASFLKRAGTIIFLCSFTVWVLTRFNWAWQYVGPSAIDGSGSEIGSSMLAGIGKVIAFVFIPAWGGNYSWGATVSALQGLIAKEQVVSSLSVISGGDILKGFPFFTTNALAAYSFICFNLFSLPCFGALAAMKKELGSRKAFLQAIGVEFLWSFTLSTLIGILGWSVTGWQAPVIDGFGAMTGSYVAVNMIDGVILGVVLLAVLFVFYFFVLRPRIKPSKAPCHEEGGKGAKLVEEYHRQKEKESCPKCKK